MKKLITPFLLLALPMLASAYDIAVENADAVTIYYNYYNNGTELQVTFNNNNGSYSGIVNIPEEVTYLSRTRKVTSIGREAFSGCRDLTSVFIPNSVRHIGEGAFERCSSLSTVTIPNSVFSIGWHAFFGCNGLTSLTIPSSVISIGGCAFEHCSSLTSVTILNSVSSIGQEAFRECSSLKSIVIPKSVTWIGWYAFSGCSKLEELYCFAENVPSISTNTFEKSYPENATLYVPAVSLNEYKTIEPWSTFGTIKAIE